LSEGPITEGVVVEALSRVTRRRLFKRYGSRRRLSDVAVYRLTNLTREEIQTVVDAAEAYVGRKYGYLKIMAHLADWPLLGAYLFRWLAAMHNYPICSRVVAHAYKKKQARTSAWKHGQPRMTSGISSGAIPISTWRFARCVLSEALGREPMTNRGAGSSKHGPASLGGVRCHELSSGGNHGRT
jgi:hypothetical protein